MAAGKTSRGGLKLCCVVTAVILVIIAIVVVVLGFTIFKPREPIISIHLLGLKTTNLPMLFMNAKQNATLPALVTIENPNYGAYKYKNSTSHVTFHGSLVGEAPLVGRYVPARRVVNITIHVSLVPEKLLTNPHFEKDYEAGNLNLTSTISLPGKVSFLKIFKMHGRIDTWCNTTVFLRAKVAESTCETRLIM
ncbi:hypothetical protein CJ030_MR1G020579 [Morella rubra]|uniref:Late embryogenesis abundant protein LEA-2 subgroup domain-containing protein n=1 Tax=Morella rubra TaxID=262757 RepID=A0A6A1WRG0_9ROSI|nr:hypothetical protein CJ030_MR1G020575 [Morella rubra]KAB1226362.1 hypothetical protein CJ030_MR1G020579 [Morella rubra]